MAALAAVDKLDLEPAMYHRQSARRRMTCHQVRRICCSDVAGNKDIGHIMMRFQVLQESLSAFGELVVPVVVRERSRP